MSWSFEGTLLPDGTTGRVVAGSGEAVPLPGRYALVGLVDAHCHLTVTGNVPTLDGSLAPGRLDALAAVGVGVVRDVGGDRTVTLSLATSPAEPGRPLVLAAGRFLAPAGRYFPGMHEPVETADLVAAVERETADGATWVKLIADFPRWENTGPVRGSTGASYPEAVVAAAIAAAHRAGARVAAHTNSPVVGALIAAGVDSVEHGQGLTRGRRRRARGRRRSVDADPVRERRRATYARRPGRRPTGPPSRCGSCCPPRSPRG